MNPFRAIARSGLAAVLLHPLRSLALTACVVSVLVPFLAGTAVSEGLAEEAARAARGGADLVVAGLRYGRPAPIPLGSADAIRAIPGVEAVRPRIVGPITLGLAKEPAVLVGVAGDALPAGAACVEGRLFREDGGLELVVGARLAARLGLSPGVPIPPFFRNRGGERVPVVVGVFRADLPMAEANLVLCSLETARTVFDERGTATEFLVDCAPGKEEEVRGAIARLGTLAPAGSPDPLLPRVLARADGGAVLASGAASSGGIFALHWVLLLAASIPVIVVATGAGLRERRREVGILKMLGWGTDEVLIRALVESLALAVLSASLSVLLAAIWLGPLGARGIAAVFLPGAESAPGFAVPWRLSPGPATVGAALALALVLVGTIPSNARAAAAEPAEAMR